jgi:hypothetical protein
MDDDTDVEDPDGGREAQPRSGDDVERSADKVDRLERHARPAADDQGISSS